jgi:hypothetical protein
MNLHPALIFFSAIGIALALGGLFMLRRAREFAAQAQSAVGRVIRLHEEPTRRGGYFYCPVVQFRTATGAEVEFTSSFGSRPARHKIGQSVAVLYDPADPAGAQLGGGANYFSGSVVLVIGLGFSAFGVVGMGLPGAIGEALRPGSGAAGRFSGAWVAEDARTRSITRVEIRARWPGLEIRMWGKCAPVDCDWGRPASYMPDRIAAGELQVTWRPGFAEKRQELRLLEDGRLEIVTHTRFTSGSNRKDYDSRDYFRRASAS